MTGLALQDENTDKYNSVPENSLAQELAVSAAMGSEAYITQDSINSLIAYLIENSGTVSDVSLNAAYIELNENEASRIYLQILYHNVKIGVSADMDICFDETNGISLTLSNAKIGKLQVPDYILSSVLSLVDLSYVSGIISLSGLTFTIPSSYSITVENVGTIVEVDIISMEIYDGEVYLQTNPIAQNIIDNITNIFGDTIDYFKNRLGDLF